MQWLSKQDKINIFVPNNFDLAERRGPQMYRSGHSDSLNESVGIFE